MTQPLSFPRLIFAVLAAGISAAFALPFGWLRRPVGPLHPSLCAVIGAVCGVLGAYALLMLNFTPTVVWEYALWFAVGGAAASRSAAWRARR